MGEDTGMYPALVGTTALFVQTAEQSTGALADGLHSTASVLEQHAQKGGIAVAERARVAQAASTYRALANNRVLKAAKTNVARVPLLSLAVSPLIYAQYVAEGDDRGLAATKTATSSVGQAIGATAGAVGGVALAIPEALAPPAALATVVGFTFAGGEMGSRGGEAIAPWVHRNIVTPFVEGGKEFWDEASRVDVRPWGRMMPYDTARFP